MILVDFLGATGLTGGATIDEAGVVVFFLVLDWGEACKFAEAIGVRVDWNLLLSF